MPLGAVGFSGFWPRCDILPVRLEGAVLEEEAVEALPAGSEVDVCCGWLVSAVLDAGRRLDIAASVNSPDCGLSPLAPEAPGAEERI